MTTTHRLIPPAGVSKITVNGRTYDPAAGAQDVPEFDCQALEANGWSVLATSVTTANRPINPRRGDRVYDSTVGHTIFWDGKVWRDESGTSR